MWKDPFNLPSPSRPCKCDDSWGCHGSPVDDAAICRYRDLRSVLHHNIPEVYENPIARVDGLVYGFFDCEQGFFGKRQVCEAAEFIRRTHDVRNPLWQKLSWLDVDTEACDRSSGPDDDCSELMIVSYRSNDSAGPNGVFVR